MDKFTGMRHCAGRAPIWQPLVCCLNKKETRSYEEGTVWLEDLGGAVNIWNNLLWMREKRVES